MAEESYPADLRYHSEHDWARIDGGTATFGITWFAQDKLNEIVFFDPPSVGDQVTKDQPYAEIESVKAVSEVYAPLSERLSRSTSRSAVVPGPSTMIPMGRVGWSRWSCPIRARSISCWVPRSTR